MLNHSSSPAWPLTSWRSDQKLEGRVVYLQTQQDQGMAVLRNALTRILQAIFLVADDALATSPLMTMLLIFHSKLMVLTSTFRKSLPIFASTFLCQQQLWHSYHCLYAHLRMVSNSPLFPSLW
uniref:Uncharacterized protein n=1 Tax=Cacopsylla melanoneura TaxID=428564 RepID=A0A8D8QVX9_9HEMI